jgi:opacity protein-like surface antigen
MKRTLQHLFFLAVITAGSAWAQNSDLGLLLGASVTRASVSRGRVSSNVSGGFQANYAIQLKETVAGRLYLELPLVLTGGTRATVANGSVTAAVSDALFFTPGLRWKFSPLSRVSFYAAVGGGIGVFDRNYTAVGAGQVVTDSGSVTTGAFGFGAGVDLRVTRLVSFRGEYRDAITRGNIDGAVHHSLFMFGVGLHF